MATRERLLGAARELLRTGGARAVTMMAVAKRAKLSRQAAYLHFRDRGELLAELVDSIDKDNHLEAAVRRVAQAQSPAEAIEVWADMQAWRNPSIVALARELDAHRHGDSASARAWRTRVDGRMKVARRIVAELAREGRVHQDWNREEAAVLLCELISIRVWDDLVNELGLAPAAYVRIATSAALSTLAAPQAKVRARGVVPKTLAKRRSR